MISDEVSRLASKRMMCLVCRSGQSNSRALLMLCSLGDCSYCVNKVIEFMIIASFIYEF